MRPKVYLASTGPRAEWAVEGLNGYRFRSAKAADEVARRVERAARRLAALIRADIDRRHVARHTFPLSQ
ncbi:MAG TPA: hypothetical protein VI300_32155 [Solirubrobacter sp.]